MIHLLLLSAILFTLLSVVAAEFREFDLHISQSYIDPDCFGKSYPALLVNDQFPAPTIRVVQGDELEIRVHNHAEAPTSIHFHGIRQYGSVESDGVPDVTQNPIKPGTTFVHRFQVTGQEAGTYFYHAHVGVQDDTIQGAFIVENSPRALALDPDFRPSGNALRDGKKDRGGNDADYWNDDDDDDNYDNDSGKYDDYDDYDNSDDYEDYNDDGDDDDDEIVIAVYDENLPNNLTPGKKIHHHHRRAYSYHDGPYGYDDEIILHLSEWWHKGYNEREEYILAGNFTFDIGSDSLLFNGRTLYNASAPNQDHCDGHTVFDVLPDRTYRMRVIGGNTFRTFGLAIKDHNMTIIEVDGELIHPYSTDHLEVTPGQRFSVLIDTKSMESLSGGNMFPIATTYRYRHQFTGYTENGYGYFRYLDTSQLLNKRDIMPAPPSSKGEKVKRQQRINPQYGNQPHGHKGRNGVSKKESTYIEHTIGDYNDTIAPGHKNRQPSPTKPPRRPKVNKRIGINATFPIIPDAPTRDWIWPKLRPLRSSAGKELDQPPDRTFKMRAWNVKLADNSTRYLINGKLSSMMNSMSDVSLAASPSETNNQEDSMWDQFTLAKMEDSYRKFKKMDLETDGYEPELGTYPIRLNETIDIVLQNVKSGRDCLLHPWHTHGHSHYVLATGDGEYIHRRDHARRNYPHPIFKDISPVYATDVDPRTQGCGWTKIRLYADNPGVWLVHCHITAHMLQGKAFLLEEASEWIDKFRKYK